MALEGYDKATGGRTSDRTFRGSLSSPAASAPILEVEDLRVGFPGSNGGRPVLDGVGFTLCPGEILGLVGSSGSGKSLLAKSIIRLEKPAQIRSGSIRLQGVDIAHMPQKSVRPFRGSVVTYVPQNPHGALDPVYSIEFQFREVLKSHANGRRGNGRSPSTNGNSITEKIIDWMKRVDISDAATRITQYPHQWSRGMLQRALLTMSFSTSPRIIILDEVTSALDPTITLQIISLITALRDRHRTAVIIITHDLAIAHEICDSIAVLDQGVIVEKGAAHAIFHHPKHHFTQQLVSSLAI